jgi:hypothetical protein
MGGFTAKGDPHRGDSAVFSNEREAWLCLAYESCPCFSYK